MLFFFLCTHNTTELSCCCCFSRLATSRPLGERSEPCLGRRERRSRERSDEDPRGPTEDFFESLLFLMGEGKEGAIREGRLFDEYWLKAGGSYWSSRFQLSRGSIWFLCLFSGRTK